MALISTAFFASQNPQIPKFKTLNTKNASTRNQNSLFITPGSRIIRQSSLTLQESLHITKLEEFRGKLGEASPVESLLMIDAVQRLGIDHHFQDEIEELLEKQYAILIKGGFQDKDLHEVALRFRLLRQQGYYVPAAGTFEEFRDQGGRFHYKLSNDIRGLSELYEASQVSIEGEDILDDAGEFSAQHLKSCLKHLNHSHASMVQNTLRHPYHRSASRYMAKKIFHKVHQGSTNKWICALQELAKTDFSMAQTLYQQEILQISSWWKDLGLAKELQFVRDQPLKWYIWSMSSLTDPKLSEERIELTKPISLIYTIDDIFDVYGTLDELTLFTDVINRWDYADIDQLPDYMKTCFKALNDITNEISFKVYEKRDWNPVYSLRKTGLTKENVELIDNNPGIISSVATILRLWDDLGNAKDEDQDGKDGSYVDCYMKEHQDIAVEEARTHVNQIISKAWKRLNQECLSPNPFSSNFTNASLNLARMVPLMYGYAENHRLPGLEDYMKLLEI